MVLNDKSPAMHRILLIILAVSTAVAAWLAFDARRQLSERDARIAALTVKLDAARSAEKNAIDQTAPLKENVLRLTAERDQLKAVAKSSGAPETTPTQPAHNAGSGAGGKEISGGTAKMPQTEEVKKMLRAQTTKVLKELFADFANRLKLSPEETDLLVDLLVDRPSALAGGATGAFSGESPDAAKYDEKLKAMLGADRFQQLQAYGKTIGGRMMMKELEPELVSAGVPLAPAQREQLIDIMSAERLKSPPSAFDAAAMQKDPAAAANALKDEAAVNRLLQQEQDFQRRVLQSATKTLNPDQIIALQQAFQQMTEKQKFGLKMFNSKGSATDSPPADPALKK